MNNIIEQIEKIEKSINFDSEFLEEKQILNDCQRRTYSYMLLDLLIKMVALDREQQDDYKKWIDIAVKYFNDLSPSTDLNKYEIILIKLYEYLLSLLRHKQDHSLIQEYSNNLKKYVYDNYKLNKENIDLYENVAISLVESRAYDEFRDLANRISNVKSNSQIKTINDFLFDENQDKKLLVKKYATFLKRIKDKPFIEICLFYTFYYREMLNNDDIKVISKGLVFGI